MRRFTLSLEDDLYESLLRAFPDFGVRTSILRRCVMRIIACAKADQLTNQKAEEIAERVYELHKDYHGE